MAWRHDSVPDGIEDDPPLTDDVATSRQDGTNYKSHLRGMDQSAFFMLYIHLIHKWPPTWDERATKHGIEAFWDKNLFSCKL